MIIFGIARISLLGDYQRVKLCISEVFDYWYWLEWQARGSGYTHGFLWVEEVPIADMSTDI
jgi:hypothetical protein